MMIIGLTGGIASGKSEVSRYFELLGVPVIDTDLISRELVEPGSEALAEIEQFFGGEVINSDGSLNRDALRELIFTSKDSRMTLEDILHPRIRDVVHERLKNLQAPYAVVVIPLLYETRYPIDTDRVLVVDSATEQQIQRLMERDSVSQTDAEKILAAQIDRTGRLKAADDILTNNGNIEALHRQIDSLHRLYLRG